MKKILKTGLIGMVTGIAGNYLLAILLSFALKLGYLMPYPAWLPESVGGEMNAVLLTALVCAVAGAGAGLALGFARARALKPAGRRVGAVVSAAVSALPAVLLAMRVV